MNIISTYLLLINESSENKKEPENSGRVVSGSALHSAGNLQPSPSEERLPTGRICYQSILTSSTMVKGSTKRRGQGPGRSNASRQPPQTAAAYRKPAALLTACVRPTGRVGEFTGAMNCTKNN